MTVPPLRKWRPSCYLYRSKYVGWQFFVYPHRDYNPIIFISRWTKKWRIEIHRLHYSTENGFRIQPRFDML